MPNLDKPFLTADLYMAAYLCLEGMTLLSVTPDDGNPRKFVLVDRDDRDELVEQWTTATGDAQIAKGYAAKMRMVKKSLYGPKDGQ